MYLLRILDEKEVLIFEQRFFLPDTAFDTEEYKTAIKNGFKIELKRV